MTKGLIFRRIALELESAGLIEPLAEVTRDDSVLPRDLIADAEKFDLYRAKVTLKCGVRVSMINGPTAYTSGDDEVEIMFLNAGDCIEPVHTVWGDSVEGYLGVPEVVAWCRIVDALVRSAS